MHMFRWALAAIFALSSLLGAFQPGVAADLSYQAAAQRILDEMTPEERIGQLFLISYQGNDVLANEDLLDLLENYHVGGILITRENDNFVEAPQTAAHLSEQIAALQDLVYQNTLMEAMDGGTSQAASSVYVPLFIAMTEQTGGAVYNQLLSGMPELPSAMAIGATWNTDLAHDAGLELGAALQSLGVNLYLGPSLDVLEDPSEAGSINLGTSSFGGDPFWVGEMGAAFIQGLHEGADDRIGVVSGHFPGLGSSDRDIEEEVATIRKSLEQLRQIDLPPFLQVTSDAPGADDSIADGLLTSHIRYQGFQGNIRATTRPISLDQQAYSQLLSLEPLATWRAEGGILVSDSLGSNAIRRFLDPAEEVFQAHIVARDAFLAGNDVLILDDFQAPGDVSQEETIRQTLTFFAQKYAEDTVFAERVDAAVLRILALKLRIYGNVFSPIRVAPVLNSSVLDELGEAAIRTAQQGATLINPSNSELAERYPDPPQLGERIVFFTDVQLQQQCSGCAPTSDLTIDALEEAVIRFYGQEGARLVGAWSLQSFTFADLSNYLGDAPPLGSMITVAPPEDVANAIENADWIVFSALDSSGDYYGANALKLFLDRRPDLARGKQTIAFAFDVPFALDATDISKLDIYYGLYSSSHAFIESAARLLFLELTAPGFSPVDIDGIGYHLNEITSPAELQVIPLESSLLGEVLEEGETPEFTIGDVIHLEAGPILDSNGHIVPDGTVVQFEMQDQSAGGVSSLLEATTIDGYAGVDFPLDRVGLHSISARSYPALVSEVVQLNVQENIPAVATVISPTLVPTVTLPPTATFSADIPTVEPGEMNGIDGEEDAGEDLAAGSLVVLVVMLGILMGVARLISLRTELVTGGGARVGLVMCMAGLAGYNYLSLQLPGSRGVFSTLGNFSVPLITLGAGLMGLAGYLGLMVYRSRR